MRSSISISPFISHYCGSIFPSASISCTSLIVCLNCGTKLLSSDYWSLKIIYIYFFFFMVQHPLMGQGLIVQASQSLRNATLGSTPLDGWSDRRRDLYLTTDNTDKNQTPIPPAGFEPAIPASEQPQTHALDRTTTGKCTYIIFTI
jgi:hypothetical protein